ncbi:MAG: ankyrin repeat domain-containing protein [Candidatus Cloacimonetes bacterium]|nr:ankyrin repeat domain-containing protein [Candidatus Cloacimonadota bacterium]
MKKLFINHDYFLKYQWTLFIFCFAFILAIPTASLAQDDKIVISLPDLISKFGSGIETTIEKLRKNDKFLVDETDNNGNTGLIVSSGFGYEGCVRILLEAGADPNKKGFEGFTSLHAALFAPFYHNSEPNYNIINMLLDHGAKNIKNDEGFTPFQFASLSGNESLIELLSWKGSLNKNSIKSYLSYISGCENGLHSKTHLDQANTNLNSLLKNSIVDDTELDSIFIKVSHIISPYTLAEINEFPNNKPVDEKNVLTSASYTGDAYNFSLTINRNNENYLIKGKFRKDSDPQITTLLNITYYEKIVVFHYDGKISLSNLYDGNIRMDSPLIRLISPVPISSSNPFGFEEIHIWETKEGEQFSNYIYYKDIFYKDKQILE